MSLTRRSVIGAFFVALAAPSVALVHDKRVTVAFEVLEEQWVQNWDEVWHYRCIVRAADGRCAYGACQTLFGPENLMGREYVREDAKIAVRRYLSNPKNGRLQEFA